VLFYILHLNWSSSLAVFESFAYKFKIIEMIAQIYFYIHLIKMKVCLSEQMKVLSFLDIIEPILLVI